MKALRSSRTAWSVKGSVERMVFSIESYPSFSELQPLAIQRAGSVVEVSGVLKRSRYRCVIIHRSGESNIGMMSSLGNAGRGLPFSNSPSVENSSTTGTGQ